MIYTGLLCGLIVVGSTLSASAKEVSICFAETNAKESSRITVRGKVTSTEGGYIHIGKDGCSLLIDFKGSKIPKGCNVGRTIVATGVVEGEYDDEYDIYYNNLVKATGECK